MVSEKGEVSTNLPTVGQLLQLRNSLLVALYHFLHLPFDSFAAMKA